MGKFQLAIMCSAVILGLVVGMVMSGFFAYIRAPDFLCYFGGFVSMVATLYAVGAVG